MKMDTVMEGGGTKIPALIGAYAGLINSGFELSHAAGTSAGAIVAAAAVAGYDPEELKTLIFDTDFQQFLDGPSWMVRRGWKLLREYGPYKGDAFLQFMVDLLEEKGIRTFGDLRHNDDTDPRYRWRLKVIASDISLGKMVTFPHDATLYGIDPDDLSVALAVRASMSIPFYFRPVRLGESLLVDGGLLSNFPLWAWDSQGEPSWPTFGLLLAEEKSDQPHDIDNFLDFTKANISTMLKAHDRRFVRADDATQRVVSIPVGNTSSVDFSLSQAKKDSLFFSGVSTVNNFLNDWSWDEYVRWANQTRTATSTLRV